MVLNGYPSDSPTTTIGKLLGVNSTNVEYEVVIFMQFWLSHRITVASIYRSNIPDNNFRSHMDSQLEEQAAIYSAFVFLRETLDNFLLIHDITDDPRMKHPLEVIFPSKTLPDQSESI